MLCVLFTHPKPLLSILLFRSFFLCVFLCFPLAHNNINAAISAADATTTIRRIPPMRNKMNYFLSTRGFGPILLPFFYTVFGPKSLIVTFFFLFIFFCSIYHHLFSYQLDCLLLRRRSSPVLCCLFVWFFFLPLLHPPLHPKFKFLFPPSFFFNIN